MGWVNQHKELAIRLYRLQINSLSYLTELGHSIKIYVASKGAFLILLWHVTDFPSRQRVWRARVYLYVLE